VSGAGFDLAALTIGGNGVGTFFAILVDTYGRITATANATASDVGVTASASDWCVYFIDDRYRYVQALVLTLTRSFGCSCCCDDCQC
jgi:hypothetical protein